MDVLCARPARSWSLLGFGAVTGLAAMAGGRITSRGLGHWYESLRKPPFQPPVWAFGPIWTVLYGLIAISGWRVFGRPRSAGRRRALRLWATQLGLNGAWSWAFFGSRRPVLALTDCALLFATVAAYVKAARSVDRVA